MTTVSRVKQVVLPAPAGCNTRDAETHLHNVPDDVNAIGYTAEGWLNEYTLMCGYQEELDVDGNWLRLYGDASVYHVRYFSFPTNSRIFWETFEDLTQARNLFATTAKMLNFR